MNEHANEQLSAFMDDELSENEAGFLLRRIGHEPELTRRWERYHLMRGAMRGQLPAAVPRDLVARVRRARGNEAPPSGRPERGSMLRPLAGTAAAAVVAAAVVLGVGTLRDAGEAPSQVASTASTATTPSQDPAPGAPSGAQPFSTGGGPSGKSESTEPRERHGSSPGNGWNIERPDVRQQLNHYLVNHNGQAGNAAMQGMMPYARIAGNDTSAE